MPRAEAIGRRGELGLQAKEGEAVATEHR